jgi:glycosyltransferase involved in cell wall biosynthesis
MSENFAEYYTLRRQRRTAYQHCISHYVANRMRESGYDPQGGTSVIYAPVSRPEQEDGHRPSLSYELLFAGRLVPNKGVDVAIRAVAMSSLRPRLAIAGDGPQREHLVRLAEELGVADRVDFVGWSSHSDIAALHSPRTLLLVPSQWPEPAGLVAAESAARGRACLVSARGGLPELVPNQDQVVSEQTPEAWALRIDKALTDGEWMVDRGREARELWARKFDPDVVVPQFSSVYESMCR